MNQVIWFSFLAHTDPRDVARVESKTFISTPSQREAVPIPKPGVKGQLGNWMSPDDLEVAIRKRFPGCMKGRTLYLLAYRLHNNLSIMKFTFLKFIFRKFQHGSGWFAFVEDWHPGHRFCLRRRMHADYDAHGPSGAGRYKVIYITVICITNIHTMYMMVTNICICR